MATAVHNFTGSDAHDEPRYGPGVLAGIEVSHSPNVDLSDAEKNELKALVTKAEKRDYPARLVEVVNAWESALFYRGFQFLFPLRGGGWIVPNETSGYGPSAQIDLSLLPTNIYSARAQMIIAALTRAVPNTRFGPADGNSDADITGAESAEQFLKVINRNIDKIMVQNDASRYAWTDGRWVYWSRFERDGQRFGWEEDDEPDSLIPENEPAEGEAPQSTVEAAAAEVSDESVETAEETEITQSVEGEAEETPADEEQEEREDVPEVKRTPRGQEVRTCHGKLESKVVPMMANSQAEADVVILEWEVDLSRAKGMFPWVADEIRAGTGAPADGEIARLARQNVKLGMQSSYVTSDSIAADCTIKRAWLRPSWFMHIPKEKAHIRDKFLSTFPNGCLACYAGDVLAYVRDESMDDSISIGQAYSGDGQNRNAMGTSTMPIQKRLNNWLDLMNDFFVRAIPKKWMDNKTFNVEAVRGQTNIPGDIGAFKWRAGVPAEELIFVEPAVVPPAPLADFIKEYSGPLAELLSGAYPALAGGDVGTADSGVAIATQRDSALGRLAPTWHSLKKCEAESDRQLVRWGARCRDNSINERIPGGEVIKLEINDLKANIMAYAESDENFPETYTQKKNNINQIFQDAAKNPVLGEVLYNPANIELFQNLNGLSDLYIPQVLSRNKQLGEIQLLLTTTPVPNPKVAVAHEAMGRIEQLIEESQDPEQIQQGKLQIMQAEQQISALPQEVSSIPIDAEVEDNDTEAKTCWQWLNGVDGRKAKHLNEAGYENVRLHYLEHKQAAEQASAGAQQGKPPSMSINYKDVVMTDEGAARQMLLKDGITPTAGAAQPPGGPPAGPGVKPPSKPIPVGAPEQPPTRVQ